MEQAVFKKNDVLTVTIEDLGAEGEGIGKIDGYPIFIKDAIIGDVVSVKIMKAKKNYAFGKLEKVLTPSSFRVEPKCAFHKQCGGCQIQAMDYEKQLEWKQNKIYNNLMRIGGFSEELLEQVTEPIVGMENPYHYRNKAQYPIGTDKEGNLIAGFYAGRTHSIVANTRCFLGPSENEAILEYVLSFMKKNKISAYNEADGTGLVRHVLIRSGFCTGEIMVCLVINGKSLPGAEEFVEELLLIDLTGYKVDGVSGGNLAAYTEELPGLNLEEHAGKLPEHAEELPGKNLEECAGDFPEMNLAEHMEGIRKGQQEGKITKKIKSICLSINTENTNVIMGQRIKSLYGDSYITDHIGGVKFQISPLSFYQVNTVQTEKLYGLALEYAGLTGNETVWDLYCGIGTISLFLAQKAKQVYGVEIVPQAIEDAKQNAKLNGMENAEFIVGKAEEVLPEYYAEYERGHSGEKVCADVIVVDPPRKGCDAACLETMVKMEPKRIVYVSCDSATLARDLKYLAGNGYELVRVRGVDQFGHTGHVETVCLLSRR